MTKNVKWTKEEDEILKGLIKMGKKPAEISRNYGELFNYRTTDAISDRTVKLRKEMGIEKYVPNYWTPKQLILLKELFESGKSVKEIYKNHSEELGGRTEGSIQTRIQILKDAGQIAKKPKAVEQKQLVFEESPKEEESQQNDSEVKDESIETILKEILEALEEIKENI